MISARRTCGDDRADHHASRQGQDPRCDRQADKTWPGRPDKGQQGHHQHLCPAACDPGAVTPHSPNAPWLCSPGASVVGHRPHQRRNPPLGARSLTDHPPAPVADQPGDRACRDGTLLATRCTTGTPAPTGSRSRWRPQWVRPRCIDARDPGPAVQHPQPAAGRAPDAQLSAARRLLLVPELLAYWSTGEQGAELTSASTTQLVDPVSRT